ncbi:MAG: hypothetical protein ACKVZH_28595 [Blastocatellia bacterium]
MKYRYLCLLFALIVSVGTATAQESSKPKRPVKNPPQYPNIIDLDNKDNKDQKPKTKAEPKPDAPTEPAAAAIDTEALTKAFVIIAEELKSLSGEVRALNIRQQLELEMTRMTRAEQRIATYESQLRPIRERLALLDAEEQTLQQMLSRDALIAQTAGVPTLNREATMAQVRYQHEARINAIRLEKERLRVLEASMAESLEIYQKLSDDLDKKIQQAEEKLRQFEAAKEAAKPDRPSSTPNLEKP